jgi:hypothetical protein
MKRFWNTKVVGVLVWAVLTLACHGKPPSDNPGTDAGTPGLGTDAGTPGAPVAIASGLPTPVPIALDATRVYWSSHTERPETSGVFAMPRTGGTVTRLADGSPINLALDDTYVYFGHFNELRRVPKAGGATTVLASSLEMRPERVAVSATHLYWSTHDTDGSWRILMMPKEGGTPTPLLEGTQAIRALVLDGADLFWSLDADTDCGRDANAARNGALVKHSLQTGTSSTLVTGLCLASPIAADASSVYYFVGTGLSGVPRAGGSSESLALSATRVLGIAVDAERVYWSTDQDGLDPDFQLYSLRKGQPGWEVLWTQGQPGGVTVDSQGLFWTTRAGGELYSLSK